MALNWNLLGIHEPLYFYNLNMLLFLLVSSLKLSHFVIDRIGLGTLWLNLLIISISIISVLTVFHVHLEWR